jgi:hypothetical protein
MVNVRNLAGKQSLERAALSALLVGTSYGGARECGRAGKKAYRQLHRKRITPKDETSGDKLGIIRQEQAKTPPKKKEDQSKNTGPKAIQPATSRRKQSKLGFVHPRTDQLKEL